ncbi:MAG: ElyC/SanA/YdcF family protein [Patescibacteria group bacterium]
MVVIFPVAADLDYKTHPKKHVVIGEETKIACDRAMDLSQKPELFGNTRIVITAGSTQTKCGRVWMASMMRDYIEKAGPSRQSCLVEVRQADEFTTWGEMRELTTWIKQRRTYREISELALVVKWWHAPRAKFLCDYWLKRQGIENLPVTVTKCPSFSRCPTIAKEYLGAWPKNLLRVALNR